MCIRDRGNTLIVVEHDEDTMRAADYLIDIGPGAGAHGGQVMAAGTPEEVMADPNSLTGQYLSGKKRIDCLLYTSCLSQGSADMTSLSIRQVVENALLSGAAGVVLGHNHPSGCLLYTS